MLIRAFEGRVCYGFSHDNCWLEYQGFGHAEKHLAVRKMVKKQRVDLMLQEAKIAGNVECITRDVRGSRSCGWDWVLSDGASRGVILIWDDKVLFGEEAVKSKDLGDQVKKCE